MRTGIIVPRASGKTGGRDGKVRRGGQNPRQGSLADAVTVRGTVRSGNSTKNRFLADLDKLSGNVRPVHGAVVLCVGVGAQEVNVLIPYGATAAGGRIPDRLAFKRALIHSIRVDCPGGARAECKEIDGARSGNRNASAGAQVTGTPNRPCRSALGDEDHALGIVVAARGSSRYAPGVPRLRGLKKIGSLMRPRIWIIGLKWIRPAVRVQGKHIASGARCRRPKGVWGTRDARRGGNRRIGGDDPRPQSI